MLLTLAYCAPVEGIDVEADLLVDVDYAPPAGGRTSGPPEDCYPDEPADLDVLETRIAETGRAVAWTPSREQVEALLDAAHDAFEDACGDVAIADYDDRD